MLIGRVTPSLLGVLRTAPVVGRVFTEEDGADVAVVGYGLWQRRLGGRSDVLGSAIRLDDRLVTIVGVMPAAFAFPDRDTQAWIPIRVPAVGGDGGVIRGMLFNAVARLAPDATAAQAAAEATARGRIDTSAFGRVARSLFGSNGDVEVAAVPAREMITADVRPALVVLMAGVLLLFVAATASTVVLQLSRAVSRRRELAVRAAMGAGTGRVVRQWLAESTIIGIAGGILGVSLTVLLHEALPFVLPPDFPRADEVRVDVLVSVSAALLTAAAIVLCGVVPAMRTRSDNISEPLSDDAGTVGGGARTPAVRMRTGVLVAQVAIACVLLVGAGLLTRSFIALMAADRGFDPRDVLTAHIRVDAQPWVRWAETFERVQQRIRLLPGVVSVGFGDSIPLVAPTAVARVVRTLKLPSPTAPGTTTDVQVRLRTVNPEYFRAMGLRVTEGRPLAETDTASSQPVVVVNRTFARQYLDTDAIGSPLPVSFAGRDWTVAGVVDDMRQGANTVGAPAPFGGMGDPPEPEIYLSYRQHTTSVEEIVFVVRSTSDPASLTPALREILRSEDASLLPDSIVTLEDRVMNSIARPRTYAVLLGGFALFALIIAGAGLFGALSYATAQRTREIGLRTALGARRQEIVGLVMRQATATLGVGLTIGLMTAFLLAQSLSALLYGVMPRDIISFLAAPLILAIAGLLACAGPAMRAARVDPAVALR